jgi:hypothetical protein
MYKTLRDTLDIVLLVPEGGGDFLSGGETEFELELIGVHAVEADGPRFLDFPSDAETGDITTVEWLAHYVRRSPGQGKKLETLVDLDIVQYSKGIGQTLTIWDAEKREYVTEVVGSD